MVGRYRYNQMRGDTVNGYINSGHSIAKSFFKAIVILLMAVLFVLNVMRVDWFWIVVIPIVTILFYKWT